VTVAGGNGCGNATEQLAYPYGFFVDDNQIIVISDFGNHRIIQWKMGDRNGQVVAGGNGKGNGLNQLSWPSDVLIDKETDSLIISDRWNRRVMQWSRRSGTKEGQILINNITCWGLAMDDQRYLYVSDLEKHEVRRYQMGDKQGTRVAGGNGKGDGLNQFNYPTYIFVDRQQAVYVSDRDNDRVMKWNKGATEGIVFAGGNRATEGIAVAGEEGYKNALTQLYYPNGLFVDTLGTLYVADLNNDRVMRWPEGAKQGTVIVGGNSFRKGTNQFKYPTGLSFDRHGNLYVTELHNHRVQRFSILTEVDRSTTNRCFCFAKT
jgi:sugar lactone lactonase YvrE